MRQTLILTVLVGTVAAGCGGSPAEPGPPAPSRSASASPSPTRSPSPAPSVTEVPLLQHGPGTFTVAGGGTERVGSGQLMRYRVEVEDGIEIDPARFAGEVDAILADPRSWTAGGEWSFRRVAGGEADFLLRLATPDTVDRICGEYWLDTGGEVSCRAGDHVMINLKRWLRGVPHFDGDLVGYRQYLINHEVGHRLGHGHMGCPEPGGPAPVMLPQTLELDGCRPNGWPYPDPDGAFLTGPSRP